METLMKKLFVGNLSWDTSEEELQKHFEACGKVVSVKIITDKNTGKSKGFGFVEMEAADEAKAAIEKLHDTTVRNRNLRVSLAQERQERPMREGGRSSDRGERRDYRGGNSDYSSPRSPYSGHRSR